jgi:hypothetical protein
MNQRMIDNVCREVYRRFPEIRGLKPKMQPYGASKNSTTNPSPKYLLIFRSKAATETHQSLSYVIRVIVNEQGKILKMSMSR